MSGETLQWMMLADRLGMSLQRVKLETTSTEFNLWNAFLEWDLNAFHRQDYYLAQIAREVRAVLAKKPALVKLKDFILQFGSGKQDKPPKENLSPEELKQKATAASKAYWFNLLGFKGKK